MMRFAKPAIVHNRRHSYALLAGDNAAATVPEGEVRPRLELLCRGKLLLRREQVFVPGLTGAGTRILFASDLHLWGTWTERPATQLVRHAEGARPDIILLGGDLADARGGLDRLTGLVARLRHAAPVYAIPGNHDSIPWKRRLALDSGERKTYHLGGPETWPLNEIITQVEHRSGFRKRRVHFPLGLGRMLIALQEHPLLGKPLRQLY